MGINFLSHPRPDHSDRERPVPGTNAHQQRSREESRPQSRGASQSLEAGGRGAMGEAVWRMPSPRLHVEIDAALRSPVGGTQEFHTETELTYRAESRVVESIMHRICDPTVRPKLSSQLHLSR